MSEVERACSGLKSRIKSETSNKEYDEFLSKIHNCKIGNSLKKAFEEQK